MEGYDIDFNIYVSGRMADRGCSNADKFLKCKSHCQNCPFPVCLEDIEYHHRRQFLKAPSQLRMIYA
jgi:hypothetical protein